MQLSFQYKLQQQRLLWVQNRQYHRQERSHPRKAMTTRMMTSAIWTKFARLATPSTGFRNERLRAVQPIQSFKHVAAIESSPRLLSNIHLRLFYS